MNQYLFSDFVNIKHNNIIWDIQISFNIVFILCFWLCLNLEQDNIMFDSLNVFEGQARNNNAVDWDFFFFKIIFAEKYKI